MIKVNVEPSSDDPKRPFVHLERIVNFLIANGNQPVHAELFALDQDGWHCLLTKPINFDLLESHFDFPSSIRLSRKDDAILDTLTWVEIKGGIDKQREKTR